MVGSGILFIPVEFHSLNGIHPGGNISLLSEIRAPGGALLGSGILILTGAFLSELTFTSVVLSTLMYISYGLSRGISMMLDGIPSEGLIGVALLEWIIGILNLYILINRNRVKGRKVV